MGRHLLNRQIKTNVIITNRLLQKQTWTWKSCWEFFEKMNLFGRQEYIQCSKKTLNIHLSRNHVKHYSRWIKHNHLKAVYSSSKWGRRHFLGWISLESSFKKWTLATCMNHCYCTKRNLPYSQFSNAKFNTQANLIDNGFVKHRTLKISDRKEQCFNDIVTPFSSLNALK